VVTVGGPAKSPVMVGFSGGRGFKEGHCSSEDPVALVAEARERKKKSALKCFREFNRSGRWMFEGRESDGDE
jgi:hypothetical protein